MEVEHKHNTTKTQKESSKEKVEIVKEEKVKVIKEAVSKMEALKTIMQDEFDALEKAEDLKISMMVEGKDKQEAIVSRQASNLVSTINPHIVYIQTTRSTCRPNMT